MGPKELPPEERGPSKTHEALGGKAPAPAILQVWVDEADRIPPKVFEALAARTPAQEIFPACAACGSTDRSYHRCPRYPCAGAEWFASMCARNGLPLVPAYAQAMEPRKVLEALAQRERPQEAPAARTSAPEIFPASSLGREFDTAFSQDVEQALYARKLRDLAHGGQPGSAPLHWQPPPRQLEVAAVAALVVVGAFCLIYFGAILVALSLRQ